MIQHGGLLNGSDRAKSQASGGILRHDQHLATARLIRQIRAGAIVLEQLLSCWDRGFYRLHTFVVMPDHLHVLLTPGGAATLEKSVQMIKGGSAHRIGLEHPHDFPIWHAGFHDRWMRNIQECLERKRYIESNPVAARLVSYPKDYLNSSANGQHALDASCFD